MRMSSRCWPSSVAAPRPLPNANPPCRCLLLLKARAPDVVPSLFCPCRDTSSSDIASPQATLKLRDTGAGDTAVSAPLPLLAQLLSRRTSPPPDHSRPRRHMARAHNRTDFLQMSN